MQLILIAALAHDRIIGQDGVIPWDLPDDRRRFRRLTEGHAILMGHTTYRSIGKPLPLRRNVILAHSRVPRMESYDSLEKALDVLKEERKVFVIGGGHVYRQTIGKADEMMLTLLDTKVAGDVTFPEYEKDLGTIWKEVRREKTSWGAFVDYERM